MKLRLHLGEIDAEFIEVEITPEQRKKLIDTGKVGFDDGNVLFVELIMTYNDKQPLTLSASLNKPE